MGNKTQGIKVTEMIMDYHNNSLAEERKVRYPEGVTDGLAILTLNTIKDVMCGKPDEAISKNLCYAFELGHMVGSGKFTTPKVEDLNKQAEANDGIQS